MNRITLSSMTVVLVLALSGQVYAQSTAYATGRGGKLLKTTDGGVNWDALNSGTSLDLFGIDFLDADNGWVVGRSGTILQTTDGGDTWVPHPSGTDFTLRAVDFVDEDTGWIVGGDSGDTRIILHTSDGGANWSAQENGIGNREKFLDVSFTDASHGVVVGFTAETILTTSDGGNTWVDRPSGYTNGNPLWSVDLADGNNGWTVGNFGSILHTQDGGEIWSFQTIPSIPNPQILFGVDFVDAQNGWVVGDSGVILGTTNGGETWTRQNSGTSLELDSVSFTDATTGWVTAWDSSTLFHTQDGGATWTSQRLRGITLTSVEAIAGPNVTFADGDYNANGAVEQGDLDLVLLNWGEELLDPVESGWIHDTPIGLVDQQELDKVLLNWGNAIDGLATSSVPEPSTVVTLILALATMIAVRHGTNKALEATTRIPR